MINFSVKTQQIFIENPGPQIFIRSFSLGLRSFHSLVNFFNFLNFQLYTKNRILIELFWRKKLELMQCENLKFIMKIECIIRFSRFSNFFIFAIYFGRANLFLSRKKSWQRVWTAIISLQYMFLFKLFKKKF